jgi:hypothetical protein
MPKRLAATSSFAERLRAAAFGSHPTLKLGTHGAAQRCREICLANEPIASKSKLIRARRSSVPFGMGVLMDKKIVGIVGALTALGGASAASAAPAPAPASANVMEVRSYADLLQPIPNAVALLQADNAAKKAAGEQAAADESDGAKVELAQYHHHHHHWRRWHHHHHHHHWRVWHHHHHHHY